ncbi:alpha/beta hydrolase [Capillimicrobium parvum]|uniref:Carboxylesterase B n=1 Tax=Capillimicrobium parvum TaxID=2884022 RepID=A0A9E7BXT6_9ACTN|nr:alpha/beta hydrolase [Capillimicrobium parvum]UGS34156.1 Carboxylesterase B [Capillimicrobium parvum]
MEVAPDAEGSAGAARVAVLACCAAIVLAGSADANASRGPGVRAQTARTAIAWHGCGKQLQCARVAVPLDWNRPHGRKIRLAVIRRAASRTEQRIGSLFVNPGGPGGSVEKVREDGTALDAAGQGRFDVVGWDIRGAGASTHVRCFRREKRRAAFFDDWSIPFTAAASRRQVGTTASLARRCGKVSGALLRHISLADTARDLDHLRRLVGDRRLTYLGISGGTLIGQTYANIYPTRVRAMVLDGVVDPVTYTRGTEAQYVNELSYADHAFEGFLSLCDRAGSARCALAGRGPSAATRVERLLARLRRAPMPAPSATPPGPLTYGDALSAILVDMSGGPAKWPEMATALDAAARGDGADLATTGRILTTVFSSPTVAPGLPAVALTCADSPSRQGPRSWHRVVRRITDVSAIYGPVISWWRWAPCASWPARSADRYTGPWNATTRSPILVIGTTHDPNTPYANARRSARRLGNAVLLTHDGYSHTSPLDPSSCVKRAISAYLVRLATPPRGAVCRSDRQPFDPEFGQPLGQGPPSP